MKFTLAVCLLLISVCLIAESEAQWFGYGYRPFAGYGYGYRPYGYGYGYGGYRPYGLYSPYRYYYGKRAIESSLEAISPERIECLYNEPDRIFSCRGPSSVIECESAVNFGQMERNFEFFGIEQMIVDNMDSTTIKYSLYPRSVESSKWLNHTIWVNDKFVNYSLYFSEEITDYGIRVLDQTCFKDLVTLFQASKYNHEVMLVEDLTYKFSASNVTFLGDILIRQ